MSDDTGALDSLLTEDRRVAPPAGFADSAGVLFNWGAGAKEMMSTDLGSEAAPR